MLLYGIYLRIHLHLIPKLCNKLKIIISSYNYKMNLLHIENNEFKIMLCNSNNFKQLLFL